ncbi:hypothetical protein [Natribacillus halophilus]|uniref:Uncharacterized protein n=1 Tax=Natribacillus halophilus TaxID=549003 RepID=A0A1G8LPD3_9BACI|nr:hypothetical protein [Natribacillus halophilus]SDI57516.1 hypothetical protein SAMN04488123_103201 [Natribacillus halophilus]
MQILKRVAPYAVAVVVVIALYNLQHEDTLTRGESQYIAQFSESQQENEGDQEQEMEGEFAAPSADGDQDIDELLQQYEAGDEIHVAVFTANEAGEDEATNLFLESLEDNYDHQFQVYNFNMDDFQSNDSTEFVEQQDWQTINETGADLVIYEPLAHRDGQLEESKLRTSEIINGFDGYPVLKIPSYENSGDPEPFVQEWTDFADEEELQYVGPDEQGVSDSALTQAEELEAGS